MSFPSQPLGVSLRVLRRLAEEVSERDPLWSSGEVVRHVILPHTQALRCRYTDMLPTNQPSLGPPQYFVSHSWKVRRGGSGRLGEGGWLGGWGSQQPMKWPAARAWRKLTHCSLQSVLQGEF